jgi:hypothetical protein
MTREKISKKSLFSLCLKPLATRRVLYLSIVPSGFSFFFKIHLRPIGLQHGGTSTKCQVLLDSSKFSFYFVVALGIFYHRNVTRFGAPTISWFKRKFIFIEINIIWFYDHFSISVMNRVLKWERSLEGDELLDLY